MESWMGAGLSQTLDRQEAGMAVTATLEEALSWRLGSFRPSDREHFKKLVRSVEGQQAFLDAVKIYIREWDQADWIEEYSVKRIGKWLENNAPANMLTAIHQWASEEPLKGRIALAAGMELARAAKNRKTT